MYMCKMDKISEETNMILRYDLSIQIVVDNGHNFDSMTVATLREAFIQ
ncbi:hypothetical protein [Paenibacillus foliorum]|nr:hypothetical protein [Paenibacillus foliorum]